jgi:arylsulfatase A-like enzyme
VRVGRHKLIAHREHDTRVLFDLEADPGETVDLATHPDHVALADELSALLAAELARPVSTSGSSAP